MNREEIIKIAEICHNAHDTYLSSIGHESIPWKDKSDEHKSIVLDSVENILSGYIDSPKSAHENFVKLKKDKGWRYGQLYDRKLKFSPRICKFENLNSDQKALEIMFFSITSSYKHITKK